MLGDKQDIAHSYSQQLLRALLALALAACGAGADVPIEEQGIVRSTICTVIDCPPPGDDPPPPPPCTPLSGSLRSTPATIQAGQSATLSWSVEGTCWAALTLAGQGVGRSGSMVVTPPSSTTYALKADTRTLASVNVGVLPATCSTSFCGTVSDCDKPCLHNGLTKTCNGWSYDVLGDADLDGVPDALEAQLARRFFPTLRLRTSSFNNSGPHGDWSQLYSGPQSAGAEWHFAVRKVTPYADFSRTVLNPDTQQYEIRGPVYRCGDTECLEIVFVIPYNWDLGDVWMIRKHRGDGEMYSVLVARKDPQVMSDGVVVPPAWDSSWDAAKNDASAWRGFTEFTTAHTCTAADSSSYRLRTFRPHVEGVTTLWVSEGKHGNYFSKGECDHGAFLTDSCDLDDFEMIFGNQFPSGGPLRNAGEEACHSHSTIDHFTAYPGDAPTHPPYASYDVWSDAPFGDDDEGRHLALLRAGTTLWWRASSPFVTCWPKASTHPPPPPHPGPSNPCGISGICCEFAGDGSCLLCAPADGLCP